MHAPLPTATIYTGRVHAKMIYPNTLLRTICAATLLAEAVGRKAGRTQAEVIEETFARRVQGMSLLAIVFIALLIPPIVLCIWTLVRDPALPIVFRLLWLRMRELVGVPSPTERQFLQDLRREKNDQLRKEAALRRPEARAKPAAPAGSAGDGDAPDEAGDGSSTSNAIPVSPADRIRQRFLDRTPLLR